MLDIGIQSGGLINQAVIETTYKSIAEAGMRCIDFNIAKEQGYEGVDFSLFKKNLACAKKYGLRFSQVHEPLWGRRIDLRVEETFIMKVLETSIQICAVLESPYLVVHPYQFENDVNNEEQKRLNLSFFQKIGKIAIQNNVVLCIENKFNRIEGDIKQGFCSEAKDLVECIETLNTTLGKECFGACLDVGHANLMRKDLRSEVNLLGHHLKVLHLHDNDGVEDLHQLPFTFNKNGVDFARLVLGLRDIEYRGVLSFETYNAMAMSPGIGHKHLLKYIKEIGDLLSRVICFEEELREKTKGKNIILFGVGKMFDVYMQQFGEKYPPVCAVDNNSRLWDTRKKGIAIKSPKEIKVYSNVVVVLCSAYYEENILQLQEMGINEYIYSEEILRMKGKPVSKIW